MINNTKKRILLITLALIMLICAKAEVKLPAVLSNGMVLQREQPIQIWGTADANEAVNITFNKHKVAVKADQNGKWTATLPACKAGGPYELIVNHLIIKDVLVGDVWLCSGQSNMELPINRVTDLYREETEMYENNNIRYVKTPYGNDVKGPQEDISKMEWKALTKETAPGFSALAYFFAKEMYNKTKVPVGIINSSWGGSTIEAWMSEEALKDFPRNLLERDIFSSDEYRKLVNQSSSMMNAFWDRSLYKGDKGLHDSFCWYKTEFDDSNWASIDMFSSGWSINKGYPINGSHWFRQAVELSPTQIKDGVLRVGCIVDADSVFVNGTFVGTTAYQYPPRIYKVPASILKAGKNIITVRLISYGGRPSFVKDKPYCFILGGDSIKLSSQWKYKLGCEMPTRVNGVSFQNVPTGMYNSMISPLSKLQFKGVLWYQGESNTGRSHEYEALLSSMIIDWRSKLNNSTLPFFIIQLPNFMQTHTYPSESGWAQLREAQRLVTTKLPNTALVVGLGLGEWNDIHPLNKKELAKRVALQADRLAYNQEKNVSSGPVCISAKLEDGKIALTFQKGTDDFLPVDSLEGFAIADKDGRYQWAKAQISGNKILIWNENIANPTMIRYAWDDNPKGNLRNKTGLPASPFQIKVE